MLPETDQNGRSVGHRHGAFHDSLPMLTSDNRERGAVFILELL